MRNRFILCAAIILLLSAGAYASIGRAGCRPVGSAGTISQGESFSIGTSNLVKRIGSFGKAEGGNDVTVDQSQGIKTAAAKAVQKETGELTQYGSVVGACGLTKVLQDASIKGLQGQLVKVGWHRPEIHQQGQTLTLGLDNWVHKGGGVGCAVGEQGYVGEQSQAIFTPHAVSMATQAVDVEQTAKVNGAPCSTVDVKNSVDVKMEQWQNLDVVSSGPPHSGR